MFEGFVIDIIREISLMEGFKYKFVRNMDDRNGDFNPTTKKWNGMIGDLLHKVSNALIFDITNSTRTIFSER